MKHIIKHVHFVGIGGSGMNGIAEVLLNLGYQVSGSDLVWNEATERLASFGARITRGHEAAAIENADVVVVSSAVSLENPEVQAAKARCIPIVPRALMLAELMRLKQGIAIAGTHGKTTTTSLVASVLEAGGLDPTFVIGGCLNSVGAHARLGSGDFIVVEADESDRSFLNLLPVIEVITNIDADHMETYHHDFEQLKQTFIEFTHRLPFYGIAVLCVDNPTVRDILPFISKPTIRYGLTEDAQVRAVNIYTDEGQTVFTAMRAGATPLEINLNLPGEHNVRNALAAIAIGTQLKIADTDIQRALAKFNGVSRRFQRYGEISIVKGGTYSLVDDYGHHPVEMMAAFATARDIFPGHRLVIAFQPHRYTRMRDCFKDFVKVLSTVDALVLTNVYAAGEQPITAVDGRALARAVSDAGKVEPVFVESVDEMPRTLTSMVLDGDVVMTMGAGSISNIPLKLVQAQQSTNTTKLALGNACVEK